jgi:hypothetical protein
MRRSGYRKAAALLPMKIAAAYFANQRSIEKSRRA